MSYRDPRDVRRNAARVRVAARRRSGGGWMARMFSRHPAPELAGLWLVEVLACAALAWILLSATGNASALTVADRAVALALTFGVTSIAVGLYSPDTYLETRLLLVNTAVGAVLAFPALWLVGRLVGIDLAGLSGHGGMLLLPALIGWTLLLFGLRIGFSFALRADVFVRRILIIGPEAAASQLGSAIRAVRRGFFEVAAVLPAEDAHLLVAPHGAKGRLWGVILAGSAADAVPARHLLRAQARGLRLYTDSEFWERQLRRIDVSGPAAAAPDAAGEAEAPRAAGFGERVESALHRLFDVVLSLAMLVFTLPLILLAALAIKLDSKGPVFYSQERVGQHGQRFTLRKFRSMRTDAESLGPVWAAQRDPRVTRVGGFIRLTRIDELPQLLNILRGEMSFIGPRPERPHFVAQLEQVLPSYAERSRVKPGLTGWAQVNYPYGASVEDARAKLSYDLYYVRHRSLLLDLLILLATVRVVLFQRGAR